MTFWVKETFKYADFCHTDINDLILGYLWRGGGGGGGRG